MERERERERERGLGVTEDGARNSVRWRQMTRCGDPLWGKKPVEEEVLISEQ